MRTITAETPVVYPPPKSPPREKAPPREHHLGLVIVLGLVLSILACVAAGEGFARARGAPAPCTSCAPAGR